MSTGSSPRAWGTLFTRALNSPRTRFIPTCMGNSTDVGLCVSPVTVHPHVHGELVFLSIHHRPFSGSSPRAWGTLIISIVR